MIADTPALYQIVYLSSATREFTEAELLELLKSSRERNRQRGITGLMLYADGNILHIIEGAAPTVKALYKKIQKDPRHKGLHLLWSKPVPKRDFPDYTMGFSRESTSTLDEEIPGFSNVVQNHHLPDDMLDQLSKHVAVFIKTFARSTRITD
ncbi:MAG: BLUF domain-containing protein [Opitutales bacterium]